jgi:nucleoside-diphosphate-sugar epimerase
MTRNILVTGSRGVIGEVLTRYLESKGFNVVGTRRSYQAPIPTRKEIELTAWEPIVYQDNPLDCIVHIAGYYSNSIEVSEVQNTFNSNVGIACSLSQYVSKQGIPVVAVGSFVEKYPGNEGLSYYATSKIAGKDILRKATHTSNVTFDYVYLYDTYGASARRKKFIDLLLEIGDSNQRLSASSGLQVQDLVFVEDIAIALEGLVRKSAKNSSSFREWQIRTGNVHTLKDIAKIVSEVKGFELNIDWEMLPDRERDNYSLWNCAPELLDLSKMTNLKDGLSRIELGSP